MHFTTETVKQKQSDWITNNIMNSELNNSKVNGSQLNNEELSDLLISVALERDKQAFALIFKYFAPKIKSISQKKLNTNDLANDIVQQTMTNVWKKAHMFNHEKGLVTTWIFTIMRNVTFDVLRKIQNNKEDNLSDDIWPLHEPSTDEKEVYQDHLAKSNLMSSIEVLPENQQLVVKGLYFLDMTQDQLAKHLNLPLGTIKSRLRLALAKLKSQLGEDND